MSARHDVVVAGGGLVGAAIVLALQRQGFDAVLVERGPPPAAFDPGFDDLRVYAISPGSMDWLDQLGVWPLLPARHLSAYRQMQVWSQQADAPLVFDAADLHRSELGCIVGNSLLQSALWSQLDPSRLICGTGIAALTLDGQGAQIGLSDGRSLQASLLVAADGGDSQLRALAGIETVAWTYPQRAIVANVRTERPHAQTCWQRFLPTGPLALLPLADGRCSIVWSTTDAERLLALDDDRFAAELAVATQFRLGAITATTARVSFPLRLSHAGDYVREGFALAGDSAHTVHPLAGQGVNLGLADGRALVATLVQARAAGRRIGSLRTLKAYARARKADTLEMLAVTDGLYRAFDLELPGWTRLRDAGMAAVQRLQPLKTLLIRQAAGL
jgi:2-octaprenylphenol hydroxylase